MAFDHLRDVVSPPLPPSAALSDDVAGRAVFICSVGAAVLGAMVPFALCGVGLNTRETSSN
jgi:hypothetical protein